jgi:anthranilate/para-aminobenzoate synthase component I
MAVLVHLGIGMCLGMWTFGLAMIIGNLAFVYPHQVEAAVGWVRKCVEYIRAGDIFQVVSASGCRSRSTATPFEVYRTLRVVNPSPFMFFLRTPE